MLITLLGYVHQRTFEARCIILATWVTHIMIAEQVLQAFPHLCKHEFLVGNIAPDCNVENEDWTHFTPSREVTHWMGGQRKTAADSERFLHEYAETRVCADEREHAFLLGYYAHLIADAEFQRFIRDDARIQASWARVRQHPELRERSSGMAATFDSVKALIPKEERLKDIYSIERAYLDLHPDSGYLTNILTLTEFPDYIDYLPAGAIVRKIRVMGYLPQREISSFPFVAIAENEYEHFISTAVRLITEALFRRME